MKKILFPNEHGAWGMLTVAFLIGWLATPDFSLRPWFLVPAALGGFLARYPLGIYFKKKRVARSLQIPLSREKNWFCLYSLFTFLVTIPLFYPLGWFWLLPLVMVSFLSFVGHLVAIVQRKERTFFVEWSAMVGLSTLVPAAAYASILRWSLQPIILWVLFIGYYSWRIGAIRKKVAERREKPVDLRKIGKRELFYSGLFVLAMIIASRIFD
ncbi:MAG: YwiC-like family protein [Deltaproteobacteria bacterium]|nr:YwiC-like family protein [Deltaproteobacteria bacterium]